MHDNARRSVPPEKRGVGLVFQDFALFPHLSVEDNIAFRLTGRALDRSAGPGRASAGAAGYASDAVFLPGEMGSDCARTRLGDALIVDGASEARASVDVLVRPDDLGLQADFALTHVSRHILAGSY